MNKYINYINRILTVRKRLKNINKNKHNGNANWKIGFIVQMPEVWDKQESVFEELSNRDNVDAFLIVVPKYDFKNKKISQSYGEELDYFKNFSKNIILAYNDNKWIEVKDYNFDYVFYQRPYDNYLPDKLLSDYVASFSKICYIPYADFQGKDFSLDLPLLHNVSYGFMYSEEACEYLRKKSNKRLISKYQSFYNMYPIFEKYKKLHKNISDDKIRIVWTPRWTTDKSKGGSHFFDYKDDILELNNKFENIEITFRPHPLAFENYIAEGLMTQDEVDDYLLKLKKNNIILDENKDVIDTFRNADILISDVSSVITLFFLTGRPVIYCESPRLPNETFREISSALYVADSWLSVEKYLNDIIGNNDLMSNKRKEVIEKLFPNMKDLVKCIADIILE